MKILMLVNWKIKHCEDIPKGVQPSDYDCPQEKYWFFRHFKNEVDVDVVDISAPNIIEKLENKIRFHFFQTFRILFKLKKYDLIFIHGSNSAMLLCALKRIFHFRTPPILDVDISSFHQADTSGIIYKLAQFSSKAFDYMVYHTSSQFSYYKEHFPWLMEKSQFIPFGVDYDYWANKQFALPSKEKNYIVCVGYRKRDWNTLLKAFDIANINEDLYLIGNPSLQCDNPKVKVLPFIPIDDLMEYIKNSKYSVIPLDDFNYSFGQMTLLQQMALGIPILAANVPAISDYANSSDGGILSYKAYDVEDLALKLKTMSLKNSDELRGMGLKNIISIQTTLSEIQMAESFENICNTLIKSKK
ncbi:glycosyltransferase family 4 protein [Streptococcus equinus]|uniref:glycosyltransferase family 4 protein n=1 Tax=Streptococcus equinus TaxID=1335 RepID=UPI003EED28EA